MYIKRLTLLMVIGVLFTACGNDEKSAKERESEIKKKDFIVIYQHQPDCSIKDKERLATTFEEGLGFSTPINRNSFVTLSKDSTQVCENYDRTFNYTNCVVSNIEKKTEKSCVIGFDFEK